MSYHHSGRELLNGMSPDQEPPLLLKADRLVTTLVCRGA